MSSEEFWEDDPKLYWAYRTFYLKQKEYHYEEMKYNAWLNGSMNYMAVSYALNNAFGKQKVNYPTYEELCKETKRRKNDKLSKKEIIKIGQEEYNYWARK